MKIEIERERYLELVEALRKAEHKVFVYEEALRDIATRPMPFGEDDAHTWVRVCRQIAKQILEREGHI